MKRARGRPRRESPPSFLALIAAILVAGALPLPTDAQDATRVALAGDDGTLAPALDAALVAWGVTLVVLAGPTPGDSMPGSSERGRALATEVDAAAVVWISRDAAGATALWVYDRATDQVLARALPTAPPFDEPTAAAVALSVKTLLRHSTAAPPAERVSEPPSTSEARLEIAGGALAFATSPADVEARALLACSYWPRALGSVVGLGLVARGGSGAGVSSDAASGRLWTTGLHLRAQGRWAVERRVDLGLGIELGASLAILDVIVAPGALAVQRLDVDPSGYLWVELGLRPLPVLRFALRVGAFGTARTRSYLVRGQSTLETQPLALALELGMEVPLDGGTVE